MCCRAERAVRPVEAIRQPVSPKYAVVRHTFIHLGLGLVRCATSSPQPIQINASNKPVPGEIHV